MNAHELIGATAAALIHERARPGMESAAEGGARFLLDRLTDKQVAAICHAILADPDLKAVSRLRIPRSIGALAALPEEALTDERATYWRSRECDRPILILANADDEQGQSLKDLTRIGSDELLNEPDLWVATASAGLSLTPDACRHWSQALRALREVKTVSVERFADYVILTRHAVHQEGQPIVSALGWALPAVRAPRDSAVFRGIPEKALGHLHRWRACFQHVFGKRAPYLLKMTPNQQPIDADVLESSFEKVKGEIAEKNQPAVVSFIAADSGWSAAVGALAELEWETDSVKCLFDSVRIKKEPLGKATEEFYRLNFPETLTDEEVEYLRGLDERKTREANEDDEAFYEKHRFELGQSQKQKLKPKWDRFIFGQPIETDDFRVGLLRAIERLFEQAGPSAEQRTLKIESHRRHPKDWLEMNAEAAGYFALRYRGLPALLGHDVQWAPTDLFDAAVREPEGKARRNTSTARAANQLKFTVTLTTVVGDNDNDFSTQVIWTFAPGSILAECAADWERLERHPFCSSQVSREPVSAKGRLQSVELRDVSTLMPVFGRDRGSLIRKSEHRDDLAVRFENGLKQAVQSGRVAEGGHVALKHAWGAFAGAYRAAVEHYRHLGTASDMCLELGGAYERLLQALAEHAPSDKDRVALWQPALQIGTARIDGGDSAAIVAPWHPLRIVAAAVKDRRLGGLVRYLMNEETVNFGDARLFFRDLSAELGHTFYPEVCVGYRDKEPVLLACADSYGDYSLMESPTRWREDRATTNEDPRKTAAVVRNVVRQYLDLHPHEAANLSVVLYNCDAARLPEATVAALSEMHDEGNEEEVRCHVQLRHTRPEKLQRLYEALIESSERDADSVVASEATRDFMARLRVGIMADQAPLPSALDGPPADIVFLQDVVARLAEVQWNDEPHTAASPELRAYVPTQWSRRRPAMRDDLRSTTYLCCPVQPSVGWAYLRGVAGVVRAEPPRQEVFPLPTRQVRFNSNETRQIVEEVHRLGQWVVNFDEILTRQHLRNLDVRVIRSQQPTDGGRSLLVSSTAPLNVLHVLVQRHLRSLALPIEPEEIPVLAERMVRYANEISGDIVLRAARRGAFAHELLGLALSRFLLEDELGAPTSARGWYFLDDYAEWLGQREEHIADILALSPRVENGKVVLVAFVSEAKYVSHEILPKARKLSEVQLRETVARIQDAVFETPRRLDRDHWLARLADLLVDGVEVSPLERPLLQAWQANLRKGQVEIVLRGYSHVFVYAKPPDEHDPTEREPIGKVRDAWQEVFGPESVRKLILAFHRKGSPREVRARLGDDEPWTKGVGRRPAEGAEWATLIARMDLSLTPLGTTTPTSEKGEKPGRPRRKGASEAPVATAPTGPAMLPPPKMAPPAPTPDRGAGGYEWAPPSIAHVLESAVKPAPVNGDDEAWLRKTAGDLRAALLSYKLQAKLLDQRLTPNAALVHFQGSDRLTVKDIEQRHSQLLTTHGLRVIRVSAEPGVVTVSVARPRRQVVSLLDVLRGREVDDVAGRVNQRLIVGVRERDGATLYLRPGSEHAPHTLIAGTTGSGKSVLLQNLILDIAMTNSPSAATITLIDPKQGVDFQLLEGLPHLESEIVVEQDKAIQRLEALAQEMDDRYRLFRTAGAGIKDLTDYNRHVGADQRLPVRWLVHDEFAEWMLVEEYKDAVERVVQRLGVKARAAGIRLIFAAQRPEDRVMPVQLRDNLGNRLVLRVESEGTSKIALKEEGAERLLGKGHLAARLQDEDDVVLAQVPMLAPEVMVALVAALRAGAHHDT
jgi:S-DNA-T family DNA segregation ATPase FtsK/SpoIIIE